MTNYIPPYDTDFFPDDEDYEYLYYPDYNIEEPTTTTYNPETHTKPKEKQHYTFTVKASSKTHPVYGVNKSITYTIKDNIGNVLAETDNYINYLTKQYKATIIENKYYEQYKDIVVVIETYEIIPNYGKHTLV